MRLARYLSELEYSTLPQPVVAQAKKLLLDQLGCQLAFATLPWSRGVFDLVAARGASGPSTLAYYGIVTSPEDAAFANAAFGHGFEMDDVELASASHPGAVIIPAVLAMAQTRRVSGADLIVAIVAGYEAMLRVGRGAHGLIARGFHPTSALGPFGAAAAVARLLQFDADRMADALGIAGSMAGGTCAFSESGGSVKRLHAAFAAQAGVRAALLVQAGFTGPSRILDGEKGFCRAVSDTPALEKICSGLGETFLILDVGLKPYCCCGAYHSALDAVDVLAGGCSLDLDAIEGVIVDQLPREMSHAGRITEPQDIIEAQFSARFGVAMRLTGRRNGFADYTDKTISDPGILTLARKVAYRADTDGAILCQPGAARVTLIYHDGRSDTAQVNFPTGSPQNPMDWHAVVGKFEALASNVLPAPRVHDVAAMVDAMEHQTNAERLAGWLANDTGD